jgi:hypothetical protein
VPTTYTYLAFEEENKQENREINNAKTKLAMAHNPQSYIQPLNRQANFYWQISSGQGVQFAIALRSTMRILASSLFLFGSLESQKIC